MASINRASGVQPPASFAAVAVPQVDAHGVEPSQRQVNSSFVRERFPEKLYRLLVETAENKLDHIVSFTPSGRAFSIHDPDAFMDEIVPRYFTLSSLTSFKRQLHLYDFSRAIEGNLTDVPMHPHFIQGRQELLDTVKRVALKKSG